METQYEKLKKILRQMFQMDQADLDFGIYRIMNQKREEIEHFLDKELLPQVKQEFSKYKDAKAVERQKELEKLIKTLKDADVDPDANPKVLKIKEEMAAYGDEESLANEVFSHVTTFFRRYYDNGDFLSLRRYKKDTYAIPYEGEEVKLHWANADQYYIKSSEYLRDYVFKLPGQKRVHFKLIDATEEKDNIKQEQGKERRFRLCDSEPTRIEGDNLYIQFTYLPDNTKQADLNKNTLEYLVERHNKSKELDNFHKLFELLPTAKNPNRTLLEKHLNNYTARFNFDFFIHKDLGGFLRRELDFYIKNEVLFIDDLDEQDERQVIQSLGKVKVLKRIAQKIITFLAQIEDFQKKLWLKKKFVVECGYCVTLDRVPEGLYDEIAKNDAQREEWVRLFAIDEIKKNLTTPGYTKPLTVKFLKANPFLIVDTKFFNDAFTEKLLASIDNIDEACDGVIINSENFQALNLLVEKYREQVKCVYIDPPYNTDATEIIYKNGYKHASWLSLIYDRLNHAREVLNKSGVIEIAIDDEEFHRLECIVRQSFGDDNHLANIAIMHNPKGRDQEHVATAHEYTIISSKDIRYASTFRLKLGEEQVKQKYSKNNESGKFRELPLRRSGSGARREDRPYMFFPFLYDCDKNKLFVITEEEYKKIYDGAHFNDDHIKQLKDNYESKGLVFILPIRDDGSFGRWRWGYKSSKEGCNNGALFGKMGKNPTVYQIDYEESTYLPKTLWYGERYDASTKGTNLLKDIVGSNPFDYPKSINAVEDMLIIGCQDEDLIVDYFGGSGTTAHAVINLNREDGGKRKYILVEMGEYFDTVLKPRIQKVVYSQDWKDGKPVSREGISHMFKYMKLESYEDTLDNLIIKRDKKQQKALTASKTAQEEYMLGYWIDIETRESDSLLNIDKFEDPFNYTLQIRHDNELKTTKIDLVETFNYLIGLYVEQTEVIRGFRVIRGRLRTGERTLVIWRNTKEKSNKELDTFFLKQGYNTQDFEFDKIFVNGDNNLENLKVAEDKWKVSLIGFIS
ncbi:site-specific DNA-methyltransferase [Candidatus Brocadia pituitae]|nr:site-specific DNA-methyltransferase [Candidatus Brocadia pituitae]